MHPPPSPARTRPLAWAGRGLLASILGALTGGVAEFALCMGSEPTLPLAAASLGLWVWLTPLLFAGLFAVAVLLRVELSARTRRARDAGWAGGAEAALALLGLWIAGAGWAVIELADRLPEALNDLDLIPGILGTAVVLMLLLSVVSGWAVFGPLRRLFSLIPSRAGLRVGLAVGVGGGAIAIAIGPSLAELTRDVPRWPAGLGALAGLAALIFAAKLPLRLRARTLVGGPVLAAALAIAGGVVYGANPQVRMALADRGGATTWVVRFAHALTDADGDGFSPYLGGGDCDDTNAAINPLALDIPGNQIDEDCDGADAPDRTIRVPGRVAHHRLPEHLQRPWNLLVVSIDALRPDHLGLYGYDRETSPNLDRLGRQGLVFERAYTPANATRYAIPSMFAGRYLADIDLVLLGRYLLVKPGNELLFERLAAAGYRTEAHIPEKLAEGMWYGVDAGFQRYQGHSDATLKGYSAPALSRAVTVAVERLGRDQSRPWAIWVHLLEPHEPYRSHPRFAFGSSPKDRYDAEIAAADEALGQMVAALDRTGQRDNTIIAVTSDHGEEFGEHGRKYHGKQLYEESILVPLMIHVPGTTARWVSEPVSVIDLTETLANLAGLPPGVDHGARSHVAHLDDVPVEPDLNRVVMSECVTDPDRFRARQVAFMQGSLKVILDLRSRQDRFFDLKADPIEGDNRAEEREGRFAALLTLARDEVSRQHQALFDHTHARFVTRVAPEGLAAPQPVGPGLEYLGSRLDLLTVARREIQVMRHWFRATEVPAGPNGAPGKRPDYAFQEDLHEERGKHRRRRYQPLGGMYPTSQWQVGEVVEDANFLRTPDAWGSLRFELTVYHGSNRVFGPVVAGEAEGGGGRLLEAQGAEGDARGGSTGPFGE